MPTHSVDYDEVQTLPMFSSTRKIIKRSKWALVGYTIAHSTMVRLRSSFGRFDSLSGSINLNRPVAETVRYIEQVYDDFLQYGGLSRDVIAGKRVVELGPGDNVGVGLKFIAAGAAEAICIDKFDAIRDREFERRVYITLRERLTDEERHRFDSAIDLSHGIRFNEKKLRYIFGIGAEDASRVLGEGSIDVLVSRGVIQEVYRTDQLIAGMHRLLAPGGWMAHKIDLRDYGLFSSNGFHPLEFLTIPQPLYALMTRDSDRPNRRPLNYYRSKMAELGYDTRIYITCVIARDYSKIPREIVPHKMKLERGVDYDETMLELIRSIRPRLAPEFRDLSDEDLMAGSIFLVARKP